MLLAFVCFKNFILYQMDVKSDFLNGFINEDIFVEQSKDLKITIFQTVFKVKKTLYSLKQPLRAWYERLKTFLLENGFEIFFLLVK